MESHAPFKRLQVVIAEAGIASRRAAEVLIQNGEVRVNGSIIRAQGVKVDPTRDEIEVRGKPLRSADGSSKKYYLFHKPLGVTTTLKDPKAPRTIREYFQEIPERLFPAGRLDQNSTGLLLMTNDGELVYRLTHPRFGVEKCYRVLTDKNLSSEKIDQLKKGVVLDHGEKTAPCKVEKIGSKPNGQAEFKIALHEGKKRQIRLMMKKVGAHVLQLHRETYGPLSLGSLKPGEKRELSPKEITDLKKQIFR